MKIHHIIAAITCALLIPSTHAQTPESVKTRFGDLKFEPGFPTEETTKKLLDEMDDQRARCAGLPVGLSGGFV